MSDRVAVMNAGRIEQFADPLRLYARPRTLFTMRFVGVSSELRGTVAAREGGRVRVDTPQGPVCAEGDLRPGPLRSFPRGRRHIAIGAGDGPGTQSDRGPRSQRDLPGIAHPRRGRCRRGSRFHRRDRRDLRAALAGRSGRPVLASVPVFRFSPTRGKRHEQRARGAVPPPRRLSARRRSAPACCSRCRQRSFWSSSTPFRSCVCWRAASSARRG